MSSSSSSSSSSTPKEGVEFGKEERWRSLKSRFEAKDLPKQFPQTAEKANEDQKPIHWSKSRRFAGVFTREEFEYFACGLYTELSDMELSEVVQNGVLY